jgi:hypothetical protein
MVHLFWNIVWFDHFSNAQKIVQVFSEFIFTNGNCIFSEVLGSQQT